MRHLTQEQRYAISVLLKQEISTPKIAELIGVDKTTIYRELQRNSDKRNGKYNCDLAHRKYKQRQAGKAKHICFIPSIQKIVDTLIMEDYSPEQIVGTLKKENKASVSVERIYQYIWADKAKGGTLYSHLRRKGRKYRKRGNLKDCRGVIKNRVSIDKRPDIVDKKERFGDLEVDLIIGENHQQAILTINDRASGMLKMKKIESKEATVVTNSINQLLADWSPYILTITADNGKEFAGHEQVAEELNIDYYFAHPYHSWERGANENLNGLIRQYFPKGSCFKNITPDKILEIENKLNKRPRKRFNYENPIFAMNQLLFNPKVAFVT